MRISNLTKLPRVLEEIVEDYLKPFPHTRGIKSYIPPLYSRFITNFNQNIRQFFLLSSRGKGKNIILLECSVYSRRITTISDFIPIRWAFSSKKNKWLIIPNNIQNNSILIERYLRII
jgi:hypothetical protein